MPEYQLDTANLWFPSQKEPLYDPSNDESMEIFRDYWRLEKDRCINGFTLGNGQVRVSGRLYFHTVYWKIAAYTEKMVNGKEYEAAVFDIVLEWEK